MESNTVQALLKDARKYIGPVTKSKKEVLPFLSEMLWSVFNVYNQKYRKADRKESSLEALKSAFPEGTDITRVEGTPTPTVKYLLALPNTRYEVEQANYRQSYVSVGVEGQNHAYSLPFNVEDIRDILTAFDAWIPDLKEAFEHKTLAQQKRLKMKTVNGATAVAVLTKALNEKGYTFSIEPRDSRAIVKVKASPTRMIVLNVLYKHLYEEVEDLIGAIETLKSVIGKFGRYTFIGNCRNTKWENGPDAQVQTDSQEESPFDNEENEPDNSWD